MKKLCSSHPPNTSLFATVESCDILLARTATWFLRLAGSLGRADPQQLSKQAGVICSLRPPQGLLEEGKTAILWNLGEWLLRMRWSQGCQKPVMDSVPRC